MLFLLSSAFAYQCQSIGLLPRSPQIEAGTLGPSKGAVYLSWPDGPEDGSLRFRLRDPNGELVAWEAASLRDVLRFDPSEPLEPGEYVIEHLHRYEGGAYEVQAGNSEGRWYPVDRFVLEEPPPADGSVTAEFSRIPSVVRFEASVPESALWFGVEVEGLGEIVSGAIHNGQVAGFLPRFGPCVAAYDVRDSDRFRIVAHGPGGLVSVGSWSEAKPDQELEKYAPRLNVVDSKDRTTWETEPVSSDARPPSERQTPCGSARLVETERRALPRGAHRHVLDSAGVLHSVTLHGAGVVLDGVDHEVQGGFLDVPLGYRVVHGSGDDLWLELPVERSHTTFLRVRDGKLVERHVRRGARIRFWEIDGGVRIRTYTHDGRHLVETHRNGTVEREEVTWPPTVGYDGTVNGHRLELPDDGFILESGYAEGSVFVASQAGNDGPQTLGRYALDGRPRWAVEVQGPHQVRQIGSAPGVVCALDSCFDIDTGEPRPTVSTERMPSLWAGEQVADPEAKRRERGEPTVFRLPEGKLETSALGLLVRSSDGRTTPALRTVHRPSRQLDDAVEVRWFEGDAEVVAQARCGGPAVGFVPFEP